MSLSRHKQACRTVIDEYMHNANVLQSVSTIGKRRAMSPHDEQPSMYHINDDYECPSSRKAKSWLDKDTCDEVEDDSATEKIAFAGNYKEEFSSVDDDDGSDSVDDDDGSDVGDDIDDGTDNNDDANINDIDDGTDTSADADISLFSDNNDFPISEPLSCNNDDNNSETCATLQYSPPLFLDIAPSLSSASRIIGFVGVIGGVEAVIQCSVRPVQWSMVENNMFYGFTLGTMQESFVRVALSSFVFTLCVIKDYGGESNKYFVVLPKRGWGTYFGNDIG